LRTLARVVNHPVLKDIHAKAEAGYKLDAANLAHTKHALGKQR
jgi:hypothetical protein